MTGPSYDACIIEAELRARACYAEPHRAYHDERHLDECLREVDWVQGLNARDTRILRWALLWHDSIYDPERSDNEQRSAELAGRELGKCGVPDEEVAEVVRLVRLTEQHRPEVDDRLGALMVSVDLAILGADPDRYADYTAAIRREYSHVPDEPWHSGRAAVLRRLLELDPLYPDPDFRARLEEQARANMAGEIRSLGAG